MVLWVEFGDVSARDVLISEPEPESEPEPQPLTGGLYTGVLLLNHDPSH